MKKSSPLLPVKSQNKVSPRVSPRISMSVRSTPSFRTGKKRQFSTTPTPSNNRLTKIRKPSTTLSNLSISNLLTDVRNLNPKGLPEDVKRSKCSAIKQFWHDFFTVLFSPLFIRHRNIFYFLVEVLAPGLSALLIFAAFTSGASWKKGHLRGNEGAGRVIKLPDISMEEATTSFRTLHTDKLRQTLIFYTPVNDLTAEIMQNVLDIIGISDRNVVVRSGEGNSGAVGVNNKVELFESALFRRNPRFTHDQPVGVRFEYNPNEVSKYTGVPYRIDYTISDFDKNISNTADLHPDVPPVDSKKWKTPYVKSGFIGLQYAIEEAIIRLIIHRQKEMELEMIRKKSSGSANARQISVDDTEDTSNLSSDDVDEDRLFSLIADTLEEIEQEKKRRAAIDDIDQPYDYDSPPEIKMAGRSIVNDFNSVRSPSKSASKNPSSSITPIRSAKELPTRLLRAANTHHPGTQKFRDLLPYIVTFSLVVSYSFICFFIVRQIARENLTGMKNLLQIHGLNDPIHWTLLFCHALLFRAITAGLVLLALRIDYGNGKITEDVSPDVLFVLLYIHQLSLTFMNYFIASYIKSIRLCGLIAVTFNVLSFYLPAIFAEMKLIGSLSDYILGIILPNWSFSHAMYCLLEHEINQNRIDWSNVMESGYPNAKLTVGQGMIRLGVIGLVYFFHAVYFGSSGGSGARLLATSHDKWNDLRDWLRRNHMRKDSGAMPKQGDDDELEDFPKPPVYEDPQPDKECIVTIRNLCKQYGKHNVALESLNTNVMHKEVTVFLGHSGCGKSTLISILAGLIKPSNGHATLNGFNVCNNPEKARQFLGVCPQKFVGFNLLTVREHVHFCYKLRGYDSKHCNRYSAAILTQLKLWNVRSMLPNKITNDELRRLAIAMALVDTPKILLFDEPTKGMDAVGRRDIWDIIMSMRNEHTIIVTTNYMDEAENLADTLALLAHGRLVCCGSLNFLKSQYDTGYFLKLVPHPSTFIDANAVVNFVRRILGPKVQIKRHNRLKDVDSLELELPTREKDHFADFCDLLEQQKQALHIMKYSIRQVTLNDIFIKICSSVAAGGYAIDLYVRRDSAGDIKTVLTSAIPALPEGSVKDTTRFHQFITLFKRSWTIIMNEKRNVFLHFIVPLIVILIVVYQAKLFVQTQGENPELALTPERYVNLRTLYQIKDDDPKINYTRHISRVLSGYEEEVDKGERLMTKLRELQNTDRRKVGYVKDQHVVAFEFGRKPRGFQFVGYFATGELHSAPVALNVMSNVLLSVISENERSLYPDSPPYKVTVRNDPMPIVEDGQFEKGCGTTCILLALLMSYALAFICHTGCILPMAEREIGIKHLILMCGVEPANYWFSTVIIDIVCMFMISIAIVLIFLSDLYKTFFSTEVIFAVWVISSLYLLWSGLMYCYYFANKIPTSINGFNFLAVLHLFLGIIPFIWMTTAQPVSGFLLFLEYLFLFLFPPYAITAALFHFFSNSGQRNVCRNMNSFIQWICDEERNFDVNTRIHTYGLQHSINGRSSLMIEPKLKRCCARVCKGSKIDKCFQPPKVFNVTAMSWEDPGIITDLCALLFQGFMFWGLIVLAERRVFSQFIQKLFSKLLHPSGRRGSANSEDGIQKDVKTLRCIRHESLAVEAVLKEGMWPNDVALVCQNLTKSSSSTIFVKNLNLEVKKGQCIALLGRGNSGKSCIAKMIAGDMIPTQGNCFLQDASLTVNRKNYLSRIGYSPQTSCLFSYFTGAQMIELMGRLRGIPSSILSTHVNKWLNVMGLTEVANDFCMEYGEGIKNRICTAMALIGEPEIIILDEPTTGIDPSARERLWCVLEHLTQKGFTIIFTTYSTDEAFALADKVVILSEGTVQCIGKPEEIQKMYACGFTITFKLRSDLFISSDVMSLMEARITEFKKHVIEVYSNHIDLLDEHDELIMFFLRDTRLPWAETFRRGHYLATVNDDIVTSYEVTEGGVDDIFIFLTKKQELVKPKQSDDISVYRVSQESKVEEIDEMAELLKAGERYRRSQF